MTHLSAAPARADGVSAKPAPPPSGWQLNFTPYGWVTWLKGEETVRGRTVDVDVDPIQLIDHLEQVPFMGYTEARNGRLAFYGDVVYANVGLDASAVRSRRLDPAIAGSISAALGLDSTLFIGEAGAIYEVAKWPSGTGSTAIDVLAGARYWYQEADLKLALDINLDISDLIVSRGIAIARSGHVDWVDPVIGARIRHKLGPGKELLLRGDIGGFGAGSEFSWNVVAAYSFVICAEDGVTYSGVLGYRALDVDYEQGTGRHRYEYDVLQHGPLTGLTITF